MKHLSVARQRFESLPLQEQLAMARNFCGRREKQLVKKYSVNAIGVGYKTTGGNVLTKTCIAFLVIKKDTRAANPIPAEIYTTVRVGGKEVRYSIPTDVEEIAGGQPQSGANLALGINVVSTKNQNVSLDGAACCIVRQVNNPTNRYVLGCHHVLALSLGSPQCAPADAYVRPRSSPYVVGRLYEYLTMSPGGVRSLDAALALVNPLSMTEWNAGGVKPTRVEPGVARPLNCRIFTPRGSLNAQFVKEWANVSLPYPNCGTVVIAAVYQFVADTLPGDSGSPVMQLDGTLHGMHFWGDPTQRMAFAIPAFMLFRFGVFSLNFELDY